MANFIEAVSKRVGLKREPIPPLPEKPEFQPQEIEPATGETKTILEDKCREILEKSDFDGGDFNQFADNMIALLGGRQRTEDWKYSRILVDPLGDRDIHFSRHTPWDLDYSVIFIEHPWMRVSDEERERMRSSLGQPIVINESISYGAVTSSLTVGPCIELIGSKIKPGLHSEPSLKYEYFFLPQYEHPLFTSYCTDAKERVYPFPEEDPEGNYNYGIRDVNASREQVQRLVKKVFAVYDQRATTTPVTT